MNREYPVMKKEVRKISTLTLFNLDRKSFFTRMTSHLTGLYWFYNGRTEAFIGRNCMILYDLVIVTVYSREDARDVIGLGSPLDQL
jgi:hypothetical protein